MGRRWDSRLLPGVGLGRFTLRLHVSLIALVFPVSWVRVGVGAQATECKDINGTDSGGDPCSYYDNNPHHCGCCDTAAFQASGCCACQRSPTPVEGWWTYAFTTWPRKARTLVLPSKEIQGALPENVADRWPFLTEIDLSQNPLTGGLPSSFGALSNLTVLKLSGTGLFGELPAELGQLSQLRHLALDSNRFYGALPPELGNLASLETLLLQNNWLSSSLPAELGRLGSLQILQLQDNWIAGSLPSELGNLTRLQELRLDGNSLSGSLPPELGNLSSLQRLDLDSNEFSGSLPPELGKLENLALLYLARNEFSGNLPPEIGQLRSLLGLYLNDNGFSGSLPPELGNLRSAQLMLLHRNRFHGGLPPELGQLASLRRLDLDDNSLNGSLPAEFGELRSLEVLWLNGNQLKGSLPPELGKLSSLQYLYLYNNQFSGSLPPELGNLTSLRLLSLYNNQLTGSLPPELGRLTKLETLYLGRNKLSGSLPPQLGGLRNLQSLSTTMNHQIGGIIPPEIGNLTSLRYLYLHRMQLSGRIPPEIGNLTNLHTLRLDTNQLSGGLPPELWNLTSLHRIDLDRNGLSGSLPPEVGNLVNLQKLFIYDNQLSGTLPPELEKLTNLEVLRLDHNRLSGTLPPELGNLTSLKQLSLQDNQLSGSLPPALGGLSSLYELSLQDNKLSGSLPLKLGNLTSLQRLHLYGNRFSGRIPPQLGSLALLRKLHLQENQLSGELPAELGDLARLEELSLSDNRLNGSFPSSFGRLSRLQLLQASRNPLLCGGAEVVQELVGLTRLELRGCCFQDLPGVPGSLEHLDLGENRLSQVLRPLRAQSLPSLKTLRLDSNNITHWDTTAVVPMTFHAGVHGWVCNYVPTGQRLDWPQLEVLALSGNPLSVTVYDFLASLSHLGRLNVLMARDTNLTGHLPDLSITGSPDPFVPDLPHTGHGDCGYQLQPGFRALSILDLSGNGITALHTAPPRLLVQADLSRNALTTLEVRWRQGGLEGSLQQVDARGNPKLRFPVLLEASGSCPRSGVNFLMASAQSWSSVSSRAECTTLCSMNVTRLLLDSTVDEEVLCRCSEGQGEGLNCSSCPDDTHSSLSFQNGRYSRRCLACPAHSTLRGGLSQGACFADCTCATGHYMAQIVNGSTLDVGSTPCSRLAPVGACLPCGGFKTSPPGSRKAADCFCNSNVAAGGWGDLLEREGRCGCPEGFHMNFAERRCVLCRPEENCGDWTQSLQPPEVKAGFWALPPPEAGIDGTYGGFSRHSLWRCEGASACPGGSVCGWNRTGTACSLCKQGHFRTPSGSCRPCSQSHTEARRLLAALLLASMALPILAHFQLRTDTGEPHGITLKLRSLRTSLKQLLKFLQILGLVSLFRVEWPPLADSVFSAARAVSLDFTAWTGVACLDFQQQESMTLELVFRWMLPYSGVVVTCLAAVLVTVSGLILGPISARYWPDRAARIRQLLSYGPLDVLRVLIFFLHLLFPSLLKNVLLPLTCAPSPNGRLTMNAYPHVSCWNTRTEADEGFWTMATAGLVQSALLSIGFPMLLLFAWKRGAAPGAHGGLELEQRRRWWGFLFVDFRPRRMFWLLVAITKDILLNLIIVFLPGLGTAQLLVTAIVSIAYACGVSLFVPYPDTSNTLLETCASASIAAVCLFSAGLGFQTEPGVPDLGAYIAEGRSGPAYFQRAASLVCLQGLSLAGPAAILIFQALMLVPLCQRRAPEYLRPVSEERREEWSLRFVRVMKLDGGPMPRAIAEFDDVEFTIFQRALTTAPSARTTLRPQAQAVRLGEETDQEMATLLPALRAENAALQARISRLEADALARDEEALALAAQGEEKEVQQCEGEMEAGVSAFGRVISQQMAEVHSAGLQLQSQVAPVSLGKATL